MPMLGSFPVNTRAHRLLVDSVRKLRESATESEDIRLYDDILEGKRSARDLVESKHFNERAERGFARFDEERRGLNEDAARERAQAVELEAERLFLPDNENTN